MGVILSKKNQKNKKEKKKSKLTLMKTKYLKGKKKELKNSNFVAICFIQEYFREYLSIKRQKNILILNEIRSINQNKNFYQLKTSDFLECIREKIFEITKGIISYENLDSYNLRNFYSFLLDAEKIKKEEIFSQFSDKKFRFKLDPLMITKSTSLYIKQFYYGEWNSLGKKEGFGIKIFSNGNFYFGTFKNDKMHGLGLFIFEDKAISNSNFHFCFYNRKNIFNIRTQVSKEFSDLEIRKFEEDIGTLFTLPENIKSLMENYLEKDYKPRNNYFIYVGQFSENLFEGFGEIYDNEMNKYRGGFTKNSINGLGEFEFKKDLKN